MRAMARRPISTSERAFVAIAARSLPNLARRQHGTVMPPMNPAEPGRTLAQKLWDAHVVPGGSAGADDPDLLYVDLHLVHEVTSPQAFEGLRMAGRRVRRPDLTVATMDHNVP